jgi:transposase-like protein
VFESGRPIAHVARELGVHKEAARSWVRQAELDTGRRRDLLMRDEREELKRLGKENAELRRANAILKDASVYFATEPDPAKVTRYIEERRDVFGVLPICRVLEVPVSSFYARRSRVPSQRQLEDWQLLVEIEAARSGYRRAYGARKTCRRGVEVGRDRVARVMRQNGLEGKRRGGRRRTTIPDQAALERVCDLVQRDFSASCPNEKWVADLTYLRTWHGFVYLAFILDCYSRMIVGLKLAPHMRTDLLLDALETPNGPRRPVAGLIAHSDRGSQIYEHPLHRPARGARRRALRQLERRCLRQRDGRSVGRDLQERAHRRAHLSVLRARRARDAQLDRLLQRGAAARSTR